MEILKIKKSWKFYGVTMINKILLISLSLFVNVCVANEYWTTINTDSNKLRCADGTSYNFHYKKGNENLLIFFNGGGACWDFDSCNSIDKDKYQLIRYSPMSRPNNHKIKIELG